MKRLLILHCFLTFTLSVAFTQEFNIPAGSVLIEKNELKSNGVVYLLEQRWKLPNGDIMHLYWDKEGGNEVTTIKVNTKTENTIKSTPGFVAKSTDITTSGMPGYREFNFGSDYRKLVQFCKMFRLQGKSDSWSKLEPINVQSKIIENYPMGGTANVTYKLHLDLFDNTWLLEKTSKSISDLHVDNYQLIVGRK